MATPKFEFKLLRKFKVFNTSYFNRLNEEKHNLVASSPQHGVVFVASPYGFLTVYRTAELLSGEADPPRVTMELPELHGPTHIAVSFDGELLAVVGRLKSILIYKVKDLLDQGASPKLSAPRYGACYVKDMQWSPSMNETLAIGFHDKITILNFGTGKRINNTKKMGIRCLCWSPSGSSLVVGYGDGTLRVYSPDLSLEKSIPAPALTLFDKVIDDVGAVHWMSDNQIAVVYSNTGRHDSAFALITAPEGELPPRAEYVGRLKCDSYWPRFNLLQIKPWNLILCAPLRAGIKLDSDGGGSQAPIQVQLVGELLREDDLYAVGVALDRGPVLRLSSQSRIDEPQDDGIARATVVHVLTQMGDLATYTVSERASAPSGATKPASFCGPCAAVVDPAESARARMARRLDETALARLSRLTRAEHPAPAPAEEPAPGGALVPFCGPCVALVDPAKRASHACSLQHRGAVLAEQQLEELVREYMAEKDLALLGPPAGAASQADDLLVELGDALGWYWCELCALRVPREARGVHERGRRHGACAALAHAAARRAAERLRRPGPLCGARLSDQGLRTLLQLYCGEHPGTDGGPDKAEGYHKHNVD